jgi:uncharacterized protein with FMN-binding domain
MAGSGSNKGSNKKVANRLVAASCAAVLAVYTAGYARTQSAADRLAAQVSGRRAPVPAPQRGESPGESHRGEVRSPGALSPAASASSSPKRDAPDRPNLVASVQPVPAQLPTGVATSPTVPNTAAEPSPAVQLATPAPAPVEAPAPPVVEHKAEVAAVAPLVVPPAAPPPAKPGWKDGLYYGWGYSRHGDIQAAVVIEGGRISYATIYDCRTRYSCSVIANLPPQVGQRQSPEVDLVSGATESADAFYGAVVEALSKAK